MELLGNEQLKTSLAPALREDRLSHSYLICGPRGSGKHTLARFLAAAMECTAGPARPCGRCAQCRKVLGGTHPDVITVDDPAKKTVSVELIRQANADLYIRPNEGRRKIYLFPRAMDMNPSAQNALLKSIEEPPAYGAFLLLTDAEEKLLPTIRSRCVALHLTPLPRDLGLQALAGRFPDADPRERESALRRAGGWLGQAEELLEQKAGLDPRTLRFLEVYAKKDRLGLTMLLSPMERLQRDQLEPLLVQWLECLEQALAARAAGTPAAAEITQISRSRTGQQLLSAIDRLKKARDLCRGNVGVGAICGALQIWLT